MVAAGLGQHDVNELRELLSERRQQALYPDFIHGEDDSARLMNITVIHGGIRFRCSLGSSSRKSLPAKHPTTISTSKKFSQCGAQF